MALGGGVFTAQNKVLPGSYINFISAARANVSLSERGVAAVPMQLSWGAEDSVLLLEKSEFEKQALSLLGYPATHAKMKPIRELFQHATKLYLYRLNQSPDKASNAFCTAKCGGSRGDSVQITIYRNVDDATKFEVMTLLEDMVVDKQVVTDMSELQDNPYVIWNREAALEETVGATLSGGSDGTNITGDAYSKFLQKIESYSFHALACDTSDKDIINLFIAFTKRMREEVGVKFQTVVYRAEKADHEGIVSVENKVVDGDEYGLIYWVTGIIAGCAINKSNTNLLYDGEYTIDTEYTQSQLVEAMKTGKFMLHNVGEDVRVLEDINTYVSFTEEKNSDFSSNQTIRVLDQIGNDIASLFQRKYLGKIANDDAGRISFWNDLDTYFKKLQTMRAIENFNSKDIVVEQGESKKSVVTTCSVIPVSAMEQLYMTCVIQ